MAEEMGAAYLLALPSDSQVLYLAKVISKGFKVKSKK